MPFSYNRTMLAGNLTRDPVVRFLANEQAVANFGLAVNRRFKGSDGQLKDEVTFVDIECWGRTAELVGQYLTKGRGCFVEGRLKLDQWDDKDGQKRSKLKVVADEVRFVDSKPEGTPGNQRPNARAGDTGRATSADPLAGPDGKPPADQGEPAYASGGATNGGNTSAGRRGAPAPAGNDEPPF